MSTPDARNDECWPNRKKKMITDAYVTLFCSVKHILCSTKWPFFPLVGIQKVLLWAQMQWPYFHSPAWLHCSWKAILPEYELKFYWRLLNLYWYTNGSTIVWWGWMFMSGIWSSCFWKQLFLKSVQVYIWQMFYKYGQHKYLTFSFVVLFLVFKW